GNLDSKSSRAVIDSFMQAKDALEATILMVTHDSYAASFCDRVVILRDGVVWKVLRRGTTDRIHFQDALL
ncbi:bacitracin ABC transporter ATP-binding protein, partial [Acinetobacter baumannii]|nr:bacitracin ABC transporter ATP-binding protein [Acinetobacter baumannii]